MAFQHYKTIAQVQETYNIRYQESSFVTASPATIPENFLSEFEFRFFVGSCGAKLDMHHLSELNFH